MTDMKALAMATCVVLMVGRDGPDRLDFTLTLDRVDTSLPTPDAK
jgi:hypothetical protein